MDESQGILAALFAEGLIDRLKKKNPSGGDARAKGLIL
jgi:hypothetical protein